VGARRSTCTRPRHAIPVSSMCCSVRPVGWRSLWLAHPWLVCPAAPPPSCVVGAGGEKALVGQKWAQAEAPASADSPHYSTDLTAYALFPCNFMGAWVHACLGAGVGVTMGGPFPTPVSSTAHPPSPRAPSRGACLVCRLAPVALAPCCKFSLLCMQARGRGVCVRVGGEGMHGAHRPGSAPFGSLRGGS
jgi:hypothetical protein